MNKSSFQYKEVFYESDDGLIKVNRTRNSRGSCFISIIGETGHIDFGGEKYESSARILIDLLQRVVADKCEIPLDPKE